MRSILPLPPGAWPLVLATCLLLGCPAGVRAELRWKVKAVELQADASSTVLEARFPFENAGPTAVDIAQVESSCGCTVATVDKRHYEPRESGEIVARFTVGTQTGLQTKTLLVSTNDGHAPTTLNLAIHLPEGVRLTPPFVSWKHGEAPGPKLVTVEIPAATAADDVSVSSSAAAFAASLKTLVAGRKYEVTVHPTATDQAGLSTLTIRCRFGHEEKSYYAYASVRAAETKD